MNDSKNVGIINIGTAHLIGLRYIEEYLKKNEYTVKVLHIPEKRFSLKEITKSGLEHLVDIFQDYPVVGLYVISDQLSLCIEISELLRSHGKFVVFGGPQPTSFPDGSLQHCSAVVIGEGEDIFLEFLNKYSSGDSSYLNTRGMWFKHSGEIIKNGYGKLPQDLDKIPAYSFDFTNHVALEFNTISSVDAKLYREIYGSCLYIIRSRGCAFKCTYCINKVFSKIYPGQKMVRSRNTDLVLDEIGNVLAETIKIRAIIFVDDSFLSSPPIEIEEFCIKYKDRFNLPFAIIAIPYFKKYELYDKLYDAGMYGIQFGLQTASTKTLKDVYKRPVVLKHTKETLEYLRKFDELSVFLDIMVDNPWEDNEDKTATIQFLLESPRKFKVFMYSLRLFPGTELYNRAKDEGIDIDLSSPYTSFKNDYFTSLILLLVHFGFLKSLLTKMNRPRVYNSIFYKPVYALLNNTPIIRYLCNLKELILASKLKKNLLKYTSRKSS